MAAHPVFDDGMQEIVESFVVEATEIFDGLEGDLLQLEKTSDDEELVARIFRAVHTVKGTSGFLSLEQLSVLTHHFEEVLGKMRDGKLDFQPAMTDVMLEAFDHMKLLTQQVIDRDLRPLELDDLLAALKDLSDGNLGAGASTDLAKPADRAAPLVDTGSSSPAGQNDGAEEKKAAPVPPSTPVQDDKEESQKRTSGRQAAGSNGPDTIRVEVGRLNALMDLVGELVLGRNRLLQLVSDVRATRTDGFDGTAPRSKDLLHELGEVGDQVDFTTTELQNAVMHTRMVQIGRVFGKFPRVVRDLAREFDKQIELVVEGEDTELDKSLVEDLDGPLVHLIRNAADHGIEIPAERKAKGKNPRGQVRLSAAHEGNHIVVKIADDGAGLEADVLKEKALENGLITPAEARDMSDLEAYQLIFRPGFSTAKQVSQVSGRGVGMDVVKTNLANLNGVIEIDSAPGEGTCFTLKLPLTLAIIQSMLVRSGAETFAVPLYAVSEAIRLDPEQVETVRGHEVMQHRDRVLPLIRLGDALGVQGLTTADQRIPPPSGTSADEDRRGRYAVIVNVAHRRAALVVDDLIAQEEVVIKSLGNYLKAVPGVAGSTILGDGQVILILDIGELVQMQPAPAGGSKANLDDQAPASLAPTAA